MIADLSGWGQIRVTGEDRVRFLQGMCTANIDKLPDGGFARAVMLNAKGRVVSVIEVCRAPDHLLLLCEPHLADKTLAALERHAIMDDVVFERVSGPVHKILETAADVWDAPPVLAPPPGPAASDAELEALRVEAGMPRYGVDVSEDNFPFESPLSRHVDYEKGCYLGQEPVSRVYFQGKPNKALRGLRVEGPEPVAPGAVVSHPERARAGEVTSAVVSPRLGSIALAYVHRSVFEPGTRVTVEGRAAELVALPFGPPEATRNGA